MTPVASPRAVSDHAKVRLVRAIDESEVAETFVRAELESPRFRDELLAGRRGWRIGGLFDGLPEDIEWFRAALTPDEVLSIRYIDWDWWLAVSGGTRLATEAVRRIRAGLVTGCDGEGVREREIARRLRSVDPPAELIAVATPDGPLVLVEGHVRLTSYAFHPEHLPARLEILLGLSARMGEWSEY